MWSTEELKHVGLRRSLILSQDGVHLIVHKDFQMAEGLGSWRL